MCFFFFSSRRRHTRLQGDWSSDVCSSDLCGGSTLFALPTTTDPVQALVKRTWEPTLSVTGAEGLPALQDAGNVLRPYTAFKLSLRLPPLDRKSTRLNSSHLVISYAVFCLKKKK